MGQYFLLLNIDKRQKYYDYGAKFGEVFLESTPADFIKLLAVPEAGYVEPQDPLKMYMMELYGNQDDEIISWAGDRIIYVGDYVNDWPDNILAAEDCQSLESPRFLYYNAAPSGAAYRYSGTTPKYSGPGVLRNLSKKMYVRSDGVPSLDRESNRLRYFKDPPPIDSSPGLGHILMSRTGWSQDPSSNMSWRHADSFVQGEWAGDRFDVRSYKDVKEELESGGWIDVTRQEARRLADIWKADG